MWTTLSDIWHYVGMAAPVPYTPSYDFSDYQESSPSDPLPADQVDIQFAAIAAATLSIATAVNNIRRTDGALVNAIVTPDSLSTAVVAMIGKFNPRGPWATATVYAVNDIVSQTNTTYVALTAHTSGVFATDLAAKKWMQIGASAASSIAVDGSSSVTADIPFGGHKLTGVATGVSGTDVVNVTQMNAAVAGVTTPDATTSVKGKAQLASITVTRAGSDTDDVVPADSLASLWQEGVNLVSASSISKPADADLGGFYTQTGDTTTDTYWAGVVGGEEMQIRYTGAPPLTAAGNLLPPGGIAYSVTVGTIIHWRWDATATKWRAVGGMHSDGTPLVTSPVAAFTSGSINGVSIGSTTQSTVDGTGFRSKSSVVIADDAVFSFAPPRPACLVIITGAGNSITPAFMGGALLNAGPTGGSVVKAFGGTTFAVIAAQGVATGTSGTDGSINVGCDTAGNVYVNNRAGSSVTIDITVIG